jgi:hypothetical protein
MSASLATTTGVLHRVSAIRCHHDADEVRDAIAFDRLRLMSQYARGYQVACDCQKREETIAVEDCAGLSVYNANHKPVARFTGKQYVASENADRSIGIYSRLVRN